MRWYPVLISVGIGSVIVLGIKFYGMLEALRLSHAARINSALLPTVDADPGLLYVICVVFGALSIGVAVADRPWVRRVLYVACALSVVLIAASSVKANVGLVFGGASFLGLAASGVLLNEWMSHRQRIQRSNPFDEIGV
jgi:hypothetical protein